MRRSQKAVVAIVSLVIVIGFVYILTPVPPTGSGFLSSFGGFYHVSETQGTNQNISYSVIFYDVNFTFLYWHWPLYTVDGNTTAIVAEQLVTVFVQVTFSDNISEILQIQVDSPASCLIGINYYLQGVTTDYSNPTGGIATAHTEELHSNWVYIVSY